MAKRQKKTTRVEYEELIAFVESNKVLLHRKTKPLEIQKVKKVWQTFANKINLLAVGPMRSADQWKKIFVEWKVNVKRKSRIIHKEVTGGGPRITKPLSDLEERLLNLISKAHMRDSHLTDSLGDVEAVHEAEDGIKVEEPELVDYTHYMQLSEPVTVTENGDMLNMSPADQTSDDALLTPIPRTFEKTSSACNSCKNSNDATVKSNEMLAEALNTFTEIFKVKAEADMLRAKAEMAKAKCLHFQTFGNLDDF